MRTVVRHRRFICLLMVVLAQATLGSVMAEPSPACRRLAKDFAETPAKVSTEELFRLQTCVHRELGHRGADAQSSTPPPMHKVPGIPGLTPPPGLPHGSP